MLSCVMAETELFDEKGNGFDGGTSMKLWK